ncbi:hypothetical protein [Azospirillum sp. B4]|uniref:hypothetical protein n=1 Tax=Azospirillum sp. B4 TaxID=95605 RepID=UPI00034BE556|nr:hypothetical protein [Azospirillum sp. B4]
MTPEELDDLLCQFGGQLRAWPVEHQRGVAALLLSSSGARARVREMRRLESLIAEDAPELEPPPGMMERVERTLVAAALKDWQPSTGAAPGAGAQGAGASVFFGPRAAPSAQPPSSAAANSDTEQAPSARERRQVPDPHRD